VLVWALVQELAQEVLSRVRKLAQLVRKLVQLVRKLVQLVRKLPHLPGRLLGRRRLQLELLVRLQELLHI
jgi:hypothetical protein